MNRETNVRDRMVQVAKNLLQQTLEGRARWSVTDQELVFLFTGSRSSIKIEYYEDHDDGDAYTMSLLNQRGTLVEELKTEWIRHTDPDGDPAFEAATWNGTLEHLYDAARREALDIDGLLDSVLDDLSKDPPPKPKREDDWPGPAKPSRRATSSNFDDPWAEPTKKTPPPPKSSFDDEPPF